MDKDWIRARKKALKLKDEHVGKALGVERSVANKILNGGVALSLANAPRLARLFEVDTTEVLHRFGVDGAREPSEPLTTIALPVLMPSAEVLRRMFEAMLEGEDLPSPQRDELAEKLARQLPTDLARAVSSPPVPVRGGLPAPDEDAPPPATRPPRDRPRPRT